MKLPRLQAMLAGIFLAAAAVGEVRAADAVMPASALAAALPKEKWSQVENSVDRALAWLALQQAPDGSFPSLPGAQPAVTSFAVMAFLSRGYHPGFGPYGSALDRAIDFVIDNQQPDGLLSFLAPEPHFQDMGASHTGAYNHAIAGLMLGEVYGHVTGQRARKVKASIEKALVCSRKQQTRRKMYLRDTGGWRYPNVKYPGARDADLSVTAWQLMFYRSARNAEFKVPQAYVNDALEYVRRCWDPRTAMFNYVLNEGGGQEGSRGMVGAGILCLSMAGQHNTPMARVAGQWLAAHPFRNFGECYGPWDRYFYSAYYCSQAGAQLGGQYWESIFPPMVEVYLKVQNSDGSFPAEPRDDSVFGNAYSTALAVLALTPAYQLLPVFQR
jgi:hypothetical protein